VGRDVDRVVQVGEPGGQGEHAVLDAARLDEHRAVLGGVQQPAQGGLGGGQLVPGVRDGVGQQPVAGELDGRVEPRGERRGPAVLQPEQLRFGHLGVAAEAGHLEDRGELSVAGASPGRWGGVHDRTSCFGV